MSNEAHDPSAICAALEKSWGLTVKWTDSFPYLMFIKNSKPTGWGYLGYVTDETGCLIPVSIWAHLKQLSEKTLMPFILIVKDGELLRWKKFAAPSGLMYPLGWPDHAAYPIIRIPREDFAVIPMPKEAEQ
jgi:hypothetical protein